MISIDASIKHHKTALIKKPAIICSKEFKKYLDKNNHKLLSILDDSVTIYLYDIKYVLLTAEDFKQYKAKHLPIGMNAIEIKTSLQEMKRAFYKDCYKTIPESILNKKKIASLEMNSIILSKTDVSIEDKYVYMLTKSFLDYETIKRLRTPGDRWIQIENLIEWVRLTYRSTDISDLLPHFLKSSFVLHDQSNTKRRVFKVIDKNTVLEDKSGLYTTHILNRTDRFSFKSFVRLTVEFLYALPTAENRTSGIDYLSEIADAPASKRGKMIAKYSSDILGSTNQAHIANIVGISQARVSQICKDFLKVYSFKQVSRDEYENENFNFMNENGINSPLLRKYHLETGIDSETGEVTTASRYYVLVGSKLISHFFYKSSIVGNTKRKIKTRSGEIIEIEKRERRSLPILANSTKYSTQLRNITSNTDVQLMNTQKPNTRPYALKHEVNKSVENIVQIVARKKTSAFDKLTSFVLKDMILDLISTVKVGKFDRSFKKMSVARKQIGKEISLINKQLKDAKESDMDTLWIAKLQTVSYAYNRIKRILKEVDSRIIQQSKHLFTLDSESLDSLIDLSKTEVELKNELQKVAI